MFRRLPLGRLFPMLGARLTPAETRALPLPRKKEWRREYICFEDLPGRQPKKKTTRYAAASPAVPAIGQGGVIAFRVFTNVEGCGS